MVSTPLINMIVKLESSSPRLGVTVGFSPSFNFPKDALHVQFRHVNQLFPQVIQPFGKDGWRVGFLLGGRVEDEKMWVGGGGLFFCLEMEGEGEGHIICIYIYIHLKKKKYIYIYMRHRKETETWWDDESPQQILTTILKDGWRLLPRETSGVQKNNTFFQAVPSQAHSIVHNVKVEFSDYFLIRFYRSILKPTTMLTLLAVVTAI